MSNYLYSRSSARSGWSARSVCYVTSASSGSSGSSAGKFQINGYYCQVCAVHSFFFALNTGFWFGYTFSIKNTNKDDKLQENENDKEKEKGKETQKRKTPIRKFSEFSQTWNLQNGLEAILQQMSV